MIRSALFALLAALGTAHAALPGVVIEIPLTPVSAPAFVAAPSAASLSASPAFLSASASLSPAPAALSAAPAAAKALAAPAVLAAPAAAPAPALAALAIPDAINPSPAAAVAASVPAGPRAIDALRANAPLADKLSAASASGSAEDAARALETNFNAAASLGDGGSRDGAAHESSGAKAAPESRAALLERLLQHVRIDDAGMPERREALTKALSRMLETPTARALAKRFIADAVPAVVRFEPVEGSRIVEANGRKTFYAPRGFTEWKGDHVEVRMNPDYLGADEEFRQQDLPATLAHELLGHGLWYARAVRENALQAFHHHDLNETNARLVGWLVDFELDRRFEEGGAWTYMQNPAAFLENLKLRLPYYALTWSTEELANPRETLEARSAAARAKRAQLEVSLANHNSWNAVIDFFVGRGELDEPRVRALRAYMADTAQAYKDEIGVMDALIAEVDATVGRMNAEPDRSSERYLQNAASHPLFADLKNETDEHTRRLIAQVTRTAAKLGDESPESVKAREDHWRGQLTFDQLVEMYRKDRERNPRHWQS
jgi:hypothetical protein